MKAIIILLISIFLVNFTFSQENIIKITNPHSGKEIIIKENRRIRVKTIDGQKISGRFEILNEQTIIIKNRQIKLLQIAKIKRNPLFISIVTNGFFIYTGTVTIGISFISYIFSGESAYFLLTIPAAGMIYGGIKSPNFLKGYKKNDNWNYEIIKISE